MNSYQITKTTAMDIALAWREIETSEALLEKIRADLGKREQPDIRDAFGRLAGGLTLGIPSGENGRTLHNVPWSLCIPIIEANIAQHRAKIAALTEKVRIEMGAAVTPDAEESSPTGDLVDAGKDMLEALKECRDAEMRRREDVERGSPASHYTEVRLARVNNAIAKGEKVLP